MKRFPFVLLAIAPGVLSDVPRREDYSSFSASALTECFDEVTRAVAASPSNKCEVAGRELLTEGRGAFEAQTRDYLVVKTSQDIASFCNQRTQFRYLSSLGGIAAKELKVISGIPEECIGRVVVYEQLARTIRSFERDSTSFHRLAGDALALVGKLHTAGFVHNGLSLDSFGYNQGGEFSMGQLDFIGAIIRSNGEPLPRTGGWIKTELLQFVDEVLVELIGEVDVVVAIRDAVETSAPDAGRLFDYEYWVSILRELSEDSDRVTFVMPPRGHLAIPDATLVRKFLGRQEECLIGLPEIIPPCIAAEGCSCPPLGAFTITELGDVSVKSPSKPRGDFRGEYGSVFKLKGETKALMKLYTKLDNKFLLCSERATLSTLEGFGGLAPRVYEFVDGIHEACKLKSFVMELVGDEDIDISEDYWRTDREQFFQIVARTLEVLETLHDAGFIHGDAHIGNIKIGDIEDVSASLLLIDFGLSRPFVDESGNHLLDPEASRRIDMETFASELNEAGGRRLGIIDDFQSEMNSLGREERPNYRKWVEIFRSYNWRK